MLVKKESRMRFERQTYENKHSGYEKSGKKTKYKYSPPPSLNSSSYHEIVQETHKLIDNIKINWIKELHVAL